MAYSSETNYLKLPQWADNDKPKFMDFNKAFRKLDGISTPLKIYDLYLADLAALQAAYPTGHDDWAHVAGNLIYRYIDGAWRSVGVDLATYYNKTEVDALVTTINANVAEVDAKTPPVGGTTGQVLKKKSAIDHDMEWGASGSGLPAGGSTGQFLRKKSATDGDAEWAGLLAQLLTGVSAAGSLTQLAATDTQAQAFGKLMKWYASGGAGILSQGTVAGVRSALSVPEITSGTWTLTLYGSVTAGTPTYNYRNGTWVRIGELVYITGRVEITTKGGLTGFVKISGLPVAAAAISGITVGYYGNATMPSGAILDAYVSNSEISLIYKNNSGVALLMDSNVSDTFSIPVLTGWYKAAS